MYLYKLNKCICLNCSLLSSPLQTNTSLYDFHSFFLLQKMQGKVPFLTKGPFAIFFGGTDILTGLGDQVPLILMTDDTDNDTDDTDL